MKMKWYCRMVFGLTMVAEGLVIFLSLGLANPYWSLNFARWDAKRRYWKEHRG